MEEEDLEPRSVQVITTREVSSSEEEGHDLDNPDSGQH